MQSANTYDEEVALEEFLWRARDRFLTEFERRCLAAGLVRTKWAAVESDEARFWIDAEGEMHDAEISEALKCGLEAFERQVRSRLVRDYRDHPAVARCPSCLRIVATAQARQCLWCGHDWH